MNTGDDEPSLGLNGRLRPRKLIGLSPLPTKSIRHTDGRIAQDKSKRTNTPSKVCPNKPDDLSNKSDFPQTTLQILCLYCDRKFGTKQSLSKHTRRIHVPTFKQDFAILCLHCNHAESNGNGIVQHMIECHPNEYFACLDCHTRFPSTSELAEHKLNTCEKQTKSYRSKLRQKRSSSFKKYLKSDISDKELVNRANKELQDVHSFNGMVISCELKPAQVHDEADIEDNITTNLILPPSTNISSSTVIEKNAVIVLDDIQWHKRIPPNFSFHNTDADQILSRLGVVHRAARTAESTKRDWLKSVDESTQKFEKCFDTSFYSKVASNVQENLLKFLDGSFNFNPDPENIIKTRKSKNIVAINTAEGFPILLAYEQYSRNTFDGYLPRAIAPKHKWKWENLDVERNAINADQIKRDSHTNNCIITLVSSLDIWTQLCMRRKYEEKYKISPIEKKTEKQNIIGKELKQILESREIPSTSSLGVKHLNMPNTFCNEKNFPASLGLVPSLPLYTMEPAILSGEWVRPRCYVCCACGAQTRDARGLSSHMSTQHPNAQVQHYEIAGELLLNADILKHLYVPPNQMCNRTRPLRGIRECTKCKKPISLDDLHQHMLDCAGDTPTVRRKCRYRPFGVRRRRPRLPDNTIRKKIRKGMHSRQTRKKKHVRPRPRIRTEVGDAETIRKMLADLPAKRHRVVVNPVNPMLRSRIKLDKQRKKILIKRRTSDDFKSRKLRGSNANNSSSSERKCHSTKPIESNEDDDNKPLKPKVAHVVTSRRIRQSETLKMKVNRPLKKNMRLKERIIKAVTGNEEPVITEVTEEIPTDQLSIDNNPQRINVEGESYNTRQQADRRRSNSGKGRGGSRDSQQPSSSRGNRNSNNGATPTRNVPLKHSIARLTASNETYDKYVHYNQLFLAQQECNTLSKHAPTGQQLLFENEAVMNRLDKPPLHCQRTLVDDNSHLGYRMGLLDEKQLYLYQGGMADNRHAEHYQRRLAGVKVPLHGVVYQGGLPNNSQAINYQRELYNQYLHYHKNFSEDRQSIDSQRRLSEDKHPIQYQREVHEDRQLTPYQRILMDDNSMLYYQRGLGDNNVSAHYERRLSEDQQLAKYHTNLIDETQSLHYQSAASDRRQSVYEARLSSDGQIIDHQNRVKTNKETFIYQNILSEDKNPQRGTSSQNKQERSRLPDDMALDYYNRASISEQSSGIVNSNQSNQGEHDARPINYHIVQGDSTLLSQRHSTSINDQPLNYHKELLPNGQQQPQFCELDYLRMPNIANHFCYRSDDSFNEQPTQCYHEDRNIQSNISNFKQVHSEREGEILHENQLSTQNEIVEDKRPLSSSSDISDAQINKNKLNKPRKGLNDCIAMLKNKLVEPGNEQESNQRDLVESLPVNIQSQNNISQQTEEDYQQSEQLNLGLQMTTNSGTPFEQSLQPQDLAVKRTMLPEVPQTDISTKTNNNAVMKNDNSSESKVLKDKVNPIRFNSNISMEKNNKLDCQAVKRKFVQHECVSQDVRNISTENIISQSNKNKTDSQNKAVHGQPKDKSSSVRVIVDQPTDMAIEGIESKIKSLRNTTRSERNTHIHNITPQVEIILKKSADAFYSNDLKVHKAMQAINNKNANIEDHNDHIDTIRYQNSQNEKNILIKESTSDTMKSTHQNPKRSFSEHIGSDTELQYTPGALLHNVQTPVEIQIDNNYGPIPSDNLYQKTHFLENNILIPPAHYKFTSCAPLDLSGKSITIGLSPQPSTSADNSYMTNTYHYFETLDLSSKSTENICNNNNSSTEIFMSSNTDHVVDLRINSNQSSRSDIWYRTNYDILENVTDLSVKRSHSDIPTDLSVKNKVDHSYPCDPQCDASRQNENLGFTEFTQSLSNISCQPLPTDLSAKISLDIVPSTKANLIENIDSVYSDDTILSMDKNICNIENNNTSSKLITHVSSLDVTSNKNIQSPNLSEPKNLKDSGPAFNPLETIKHTMIEPDPSDIITSLNPMLDSGTRIECEIPKQSNSDSLANSSKEQFPLDRILDTCPPPASEDNTINTTISNSTSVYTLAGPLYTSVNYGTIASPDTPVLPDTFSSATTVPHKLIEDSKSMSTNSAVTIVTTNEDAQRLNKESINEDQDLETASKIAMLPKELVEILGTMPEDHRNQLLKVLPQYVSSSTSKSVLETGLSKSITHSSVATTSVVTQTSTQKTSFPEDLDVKILPESGILTYSTLKEHCKASTEHMDLNREDVSFVPNLTPSVIKPEENIDDIICIQESESQCETLIKVIDLTNEEELPTIIVNGIVTPNLSQKVNDESTLIRSSKPKTSEQTASLRAVRIKAPSQRKKSISSETPKDSKKSFESSLTLRDGENNSTDAPANVVTPTYKSFAVQQADISSTQFVKKHAPVIENTNSKSKIIEQNQLLSNKNTSLTDTNNSVNIAIYSTLKPTDENINKKDNPIIAPTLNLDITLSDLSTGPIQCSTPKSHIAKVVQPSEQSLDKITISEVDSDDDVSLAVIVKQKQVSKEKVTIIPTPIRRKVTTKKGKNKQKRMKKIKNEIIKTAIPCAIDKKDNEKSMPIIEVTSKLLKPKGNKELDKSENYVDNALSTRDIKKHPKKHNRKDKEATVSFAKAFLNDKKLSNKRNNDIASVVDEINMCNSNITKQSAPNEDNLGLNLIRTENISIESNLQIKDKLDLCHSEVKDNTKLEPDIIKSKIKDVKITTDMTIAQCTSASNKSNSDKNNLNNHHVTLFDSDLYTSDKIKARLNESDHYDVTQKFATFEDSLESECSSNDSKKKKSSQLKRLMNEVNIDNNVETNTTMKNAAIDEKTIAPLRRSSRVKSLVENTSISEDANHPDILTGYKNPITKKQLIFSKLLLDEENTKVVECSTTNTVLEKKSLTDVKENESNSPKLSDIESVPVKKTNKSVKRKRSILKQKNKKKKFNSDKANTSSLQTLHIGERSKSLQKELETIECIKLPVKCLGSQLDVDNDSKRSTTVNINEVTDKIDSKTSNTTEKRKISDASTSSGEPIVNSKAKKSKLKTDNKLKLIDDENRIKINDVDNYNEIQESRTITCYNISATRRTRSKSVTTKANNLTHVYDPYNIDLDVNLHDVVEKPNSFSQEKANIINPAVKLDGTHKNDRKQCKSSTSITKTDCENLNSESNHNISDSDESCTSDVPLKKYVEEKEKKLTETAECSFTVKECGNGKQLLKNQELDEFQSGETIECGESTNVFKKCETNPVKDAEKAEQLRSEQFMESFGFFSERKPRKSNLLATKKISETFHIIATENDDVYLGTKDRPGRKIHGESKKHAEVESESSKPSKRDRKKKPSVKFTHCFCHVCKKEFRRPDNYVRHQLTLIHVSKLSEIEMKIKTNRVVEEPNYLIAYKLQLDKLKILTNKLTKRKKNSKNTSKIKLPTMEQILADVSKSVREQQLSQRGLSRDEELFLDCCEMLKESHKTDVTSSDAIGVKEVNNIVCPPQTSVTGLDLIEKGIENEKSDTKSEGDVDSITAKTILESEEVRNLENDLISGLKEAANANNRKVNSVDYHHVSDEVVAQEESFERYSSPNLTGSQFDQTEDIEETIKELDTRKSKKYPEYKEKMYPDITIDDIDMFEDKFDKIKRKCRSQAAAAKQPQAIEVNNSVKVRGRKSEKKKGKKSSKKNTVLTKGALKGFDGIKVSIPTSDINMAAIVPSMESSSKKKKKTSSKRKTPKKDFENNSKYENSNRSGENVVQKKLDVYEFMDNEDVELFDFRPSTLMERFKSISNKEIPCSTKTHLDNEIENSNNSVSDGDDFVYMSDDYVCSDDETETSLMSFDLSTNKLSDTKKIATLKKNNTLEKNAVMGKIFKNNAVRSEKKAPKCKEVIKSKANLDQLFDSLLEDELNSSMLNDDTTSSKKEKVDMSPVSSESEASKNIDNRSPKNIDNHFSPPMSKRNSTAFKAYVHSPSKTHPNVEKNSEDTLNKFERSRSLSYDGAQSESDCGPSISKKYDMYPPKRTSLKKSENVTKHGNDLEAKISIYENNPPKRKYEAMPLSSEQVLEKLTPKSKHSKEKSPSSKYADSVHCDYSTDIFQHSLLDDAGVARQRARRKCTVGKQNVLAETWSSESEPDGMPPRPNSAESVVPGGGRKKKGRKKECPQSTVKRGNRHISFRKQDVDSRVTSGNRKVFSSGAGSENAGGSGAGSSETGCGEVSKVCSSVTAMSATTPISPHGASSKVRPRTTAYYNWSSEGDDEQEHLQQHGWIVGDSHKKLVTMLAHAKGRKRNHDDKRHLIE